MKRRNILPVLKKSILFLSLLGLASFLLFHFYQKKKKNFVDSIRPSVNTLAHTEKVKLFSEKLTPHKITLNHLSEGYISESAQEFIYGDMQHGVLQDLRKKENYESFVAKGQTEFEKLSYLNQWVAERWSDQKVRLWLPFNATAVLSYIDDKKTGGFCAHYAIVFVQAALSLGYQARYIDINIPRGGGHFTSEVWSNDYNKWVVMDSYNGVHFESEGIPLSALELHHFILMDRTSWIDVIGLRPNKKSISLIEYYKHVAYVKRNNHYMLDNHRKENWDTSGPAYGAWLRKTRALFYVSWMDLTWGKIPFQSDGRPEMGWKTFTDNKAEFDFAINQTVFQDLAYDDKNNILSLSVDQNAPQFKNFVFQVNGGAWQKWTGDVFEWSLASGNNTLEMRTENIFGILGPPAQINVTQSL